MTTSSELINIDGESLCFGEGVSNKMFSEIMNIRHNIHYHWFPRSVNIFYNTKLGCMYTFTELLTNNILPNLINVPISNIKYDNCSSNESCSVTIPHDGVSTKLIFKKLICTNVTTTDYTFTINCESKHAQYCIEYLSHSSSVIISFGDKKYMEKYCGKYIKSDCSRIVNDIINSFNTIASSVDETTRKSMNLTNIANLISEIKKSMIDNNCYVK